MVVFCQKKIQFPSSTWKILNTPGFHSVGSESPWGGFWLTVPAQPAGFWALPSWVEWPPRPGQEGQPLVGFFRRWGSSFLCERGNASPQIRNGSEWNISLYLSSFGLASFKDKLKFHSFLRGRILMKSWRWDIGSWADSWNEVSLCDHLQIHTAHQINTRTFSGFFWLMLLWARLEKKESLQTNWGWWWLVQSGQLWAPGVKAYRTNLDRNTDGLCGKGP